MLKKTLTVLFYLLFFLTPLIFLPVSNELFEFNKMIFVYILTTLITGLWIIRMVLERKLIFKATPLDIPLILFLISQILSTIFSIDPHTSIWGYYSRSNGGLLSVISYILLFYALVSNFEREGYLNFLKSAFLGGLLVSLWAIPEHFGHSPSCLLLTGSFDDSCWVQDVQSRVFATLGQPNWLAAYLEMLIFILMFFYFTTKKISGKIYTFVLLVLFYLAFTFTYSRGATLGLAAGFLVVALAVIRTIYFERPKTGIKFNILKPLGFIVLAFLISNFIFGSALSRFQLFSPSPAPSPASSPGSPAAAGVTQLESEGTESSQIRLIVWKGALDIFRHYPIFGSGVETFAYSYYQFRPEAQNHVSEWDFLYNKAHNEYLNYLANTGIVGFLSYMLIITAFILWSIRTFLKSKDSQTRLLVLMILASYTSYLVQNIFQFSVVIIAVFFFLFPAVAFSCPEKIEFWPIPKFKFFEKLADFFGDFFGKKLAIHSLARSTVLIAAGVAMVFFLINIGRVWLADASYARGSKYLDEGSSGKAYNDLIDAVDLNPREPLYKIQLGFAAASASLALSDQDATLSAQLKDIALLETQRGLRASPKNITLWRTAIRTYFEIAALDPSYEQKSIDTINQAITLAPTDPKLYYNKALILEQDGKNTEAFQAYNQTLALKDDYHDAMVSLADFYVSQKEPDKARDELNQVLKYFPNDPEATQKLQQIASASAQLKQ